MTIINPTVAPYERLSRSRRFVGLDQDDMARLLGRSRNTISAWERGVNEPPVSAVAAWARITGQTIDWIMWGDETPEASTDPVEASKWCAPRDLNPEPTD